MSQRDRILLGVVGVLAAIAAAWLLVVQPKRGEAASLGKQVQSEQAQLDSARSEVAAGESARSGYARSYTTMVRLGQAVPDDENMPSLIFQLQGAASASDVDFRGLSLTSSTSSAPPPPSASSAAATQTAAASLPPGATLGPAGFPLEPFTFTFRGNFFHLSNFFGRIERFVSASNNQVSVNGRLITLNAINLGPGPQGFPQITASISATTFLVPRTQGLLGGATPSAPSAPSVPAASAVQPASTTPATPATPAAVATPPR